VNTAVDAYEGKDVDLGDDLSDQEITSEDSYVENESLDLTDAEEDEGAADKDNDEEVASVEDETLWRTLQTTKAKT
jgi:hypothetical protein